MSRLRFNYHIVWDVVGTRDNRRRSIWNRFVTTIENLLNLDTSEVRLFLTFSCSRDDPRVVMP